MNEIMPYYNQMYESSKLKIDPLSTIDLEEVFSRKSKLLVRELLARLEQVIIQIISIVQIQQIMENK